MLNHRSKPSSTRHQRGEVHLGALALCAAAALAVATGGEALVDSVVACAEATLQYLARLLDPEFWFAGIGR